MGLLTLIQIPCHHLLSNEIDLNLKYHIGLKQFCNINLGIGIIKKTTFFCSYFWHISLCFYSNFDRERSLDVKLNSTPNEYQLNILLIGLATPKTRNTWKKWWWCHHHVFSSISCFWGREDHKNYAEWVLIGCII